MNERTYNRLANIFVFVAIGSALLFDAGKFSHIGVGVVGGVAGAGALALYFLNQRRGLAARDVESATKELPAKIGAKVLAGRYPAETQASGAAETQAFVETQALVKKVVLESILGNQFDRYVVQTYCREEVRVYLHRNAARYSGAHRWNLVKAAPRLQQQEMVLSPNDVAACAIEIIRNLSSGEDHDRWEFSFGPNGLRVSSKKGQPDRPMDSQGDFGFAPMASTMVQ